MTGKEDKKEESTPGSNREQGNISLHCPKLTESNYTQWAILMETILKAYCLWEAIDSTEKVDEKKAHTTIAMIFQTIRARFKNLGSTLKDKTIVRKLLNSVPKKFLPIVATIEQYSEIDTMLFEEAIGRITAFEERIKSTDEPEDKQESKTLVVQILRGTNLRGTILRGSNLRGKTFVVLTCVVLTCVVRSSKQKENLCGTSMTKDKEGSSMSTVQENVALKCVQLTDSNYTHWAILMETILKAYCLWEPIGSTEKVDEKKAHTTKAMIFQTIRARFKNLGSTLKDKTIVRKLLNSVPKKCLPIVATIEQYSEIDTMPFEEVIGRITAFEERIKSTDEPEEYDPRKLLRKEPKQNQTRINILPADNMQA
ncbi:zinc finger, CCHC-type [Artemisia annua]|uniref:Zinc finger, CCHC-type n=1 Tax=Artemisia annua TaxID=35608 RepID=A0A2U1QN21_ARTAN|nr:zinc finger, CCHC-type [Artemisia annua]